MLNGIVALIVAILATGLFVEFLRRKDGIGRILLLIFFGTISVWSYVRGITLVLLYYHLINSRLGMDIIGKIHYLIYVPIIVAVMYLWRKD